MTRATRCPAPELIVAARAGTLSTSLQHAVDAHVAQCEVCRTLGDALADDALTNLTPEESGRIRDRVHAGLAQSSRDLVRQRIWKAASAIVVVGLAAGTWMIVSSRRVEPTPGLPPGSESSRRGTHDERAAPACSGANASSRRGDGRRRQPARRRESQRIHDAGTRPRWRWPRERALPQRPVRTGATASSAYRWVRHRPWSSVPRSRAISPPWPPPERRRTCKPT